jgi:hypothetical protein
MNSFPAIDSPTVVVMALILIDSSCPVDFLSVVKFIIYLLSSNFSPSCG